MYYSSLWEFFGLRQGLVNRYGNDHGFVPFCSNHNHTISYAWLGWPLWTIYVTNDHGYLPLVVNTPRSFPRSWLIIRFVTRLTRRVSLVEQELPTLTEHLSSPPVFSGVRVTRSLVLYVFLVDRCLSFCSFSFGHWVVCSSSIYEFLLPLWYLQTLLTKNVPLDYW